MPAGFQAAASTEFVIMAVASILYSNDFCTSFGQQHGMICSCFKCASGTQSFSLDGESDSQLITRLLVNGMNVKKKRKKFHLVPYRHLYRISYLAWVSVIVYCFPLQPRIGLHNLT